MPAEADVPLEIPIRMPARLYAPGRARFYLDMAAARDDEALPPFTPPGALLARRISRVDRVAYSGWIDSGGIYRFEAPAEDVALNPADFVETATPPGRTVQDRAPVVVLRRGQAAPPAPPPRVVPDPTRCVALVAAPALSRVPPAQVLRNGAAKPHIEFYPAPVNDALSGLLAVEVDAERHGRFLVREDGGPVVDPRPVRELVFDAAGRPQAPPLPWWDASAGLTPCVFAAPQLRGVWRSVNPGALRQLDTPELALIMDPHPHLTSEALPPGEGPNVSIVVSYDFASLELRSFRRVRTNLLIVPTVERASARRRAEGWIAHIRDHESGNLIAKALDALPAPIERGIRTVARSAAVQIVLAAASLGAATVATTALAQAAAAGTAGAGLNVGGAAAATIPASPAAPVSSSAAPSLARAAGSSANMTGESAEEAAPLAAKAAPVVAPKTTNELLAEVAKGSTYLAGLDDFYGLVLRELVIQAQLTQEQRDELRLELALLKLKVAEEGGQTLAIAVQVYRIARAIVLTVGTGGAAEAAEQAVEQTAQQFLDAAQRAIEALTRAINAHDQAELLRIVEEKIRARNAEGIAALEAALNAPALGTAAPALDASLAAPGLGAAAIPAAPAPLEADSGPLARLVALLRELGASIAHLLEASGNLVRSGGQ